MDSRSAPDLAVHFGDWSLRFIKDVVLKGEEDWFLIVKGMRAG